MISDITNLDDSTREEIIKEINILFRRREFMPCRFTWTQLKTVAQYLRDNHGYLQGETVQYIDSLLEPYNEPECSYIFAIVKVIASGGDLKSIRSSVRADNQRLRRFIQKRVEKKESSFLGKIKQSMGVK
ncbi:MAG: hypothetical protein ACRBB4_04995 [Neptuniibacter sp.]